MNQFFGLLLVSSLLIFSSTVFAQPNITSFSPTSGEVGSSVTITGVNFNPVVTDNIIYFGGIRVPNADIANVVAGSQISVIVPVGANSLSHITLFDNSTNLGDDAEQLFNVTFADGVFVNTHYDDAVEFTGSTANPREIQSGDFDGDGKMDVITYSGTSAITLFQNNSTIGTPSFTTSTIGNTVFVGLAVGDLNGDGKLDILGTQNGSGGDGFGMHMFENMSSGPGDFTFGSPVYIAHTNFVFDVEIADMDGDGKMDIIINNQGGIRVSIFKNNHSSGALSAADFSSRTNLNASSCNGAMMDIADINNDNKPDILITNHCSTVVNVYTNESTPGTMSFPSRISLTTEVASTFSVFAADFDNDGLPDILVSNGTSGNNVAVFRNTNSSPGVSSFAARIEFPFGTNARYSNVGDVDGDGKIDIIVNDAGSGTVKIMHNTSTGSGNIAFDDAEIYAGSTALVTDIDNDNFPDLVLAKGTQARLLVYRYNPGAFIMTWQTTTANESITIPTTGTGYNYTVQWGDGQSSSSQTGDATHNYTTAGTYTVSISGTFPRIYFYNSGDKTKIQTIEQWGNISWGSMDSAFYGATNLTIPALDVPDLSTVTSLGGMFYGASAFNSDISDWEVSNVTTMANMFREATAFNQDISDWDVSKLNSFQLMFREASSFDNGGVILDWENMGWDASVDTITMGSMFREATAFNQDISGWDISKVHSFARMFQGASSFNNGGVPLNWTTMGKSTNVEDIRLNFMYAGASSFNHDISDWDVSKVESFYAMFASNSSFNNGGVPLDWATMGQVGVDTVDLGYMFSEASAFNQDISTWNVSKVWNFRHMFVDNTAFNNGGGPLDWVDVGQDANVTSINLQNMFDGATAFDQDIGSWDIGKANSMADMLSGSGLSTANYDATLIGWADDNGMTETIPSGLTLGASGLNYCNAATEHAELQDPAGAYNWTITDAGVLCVPEINVYAGTDNTYSQIINDQTSDVNMTSVTYGDDLTQTIAIVNTGVIPLDVTSITASEIFTINPANASIPVGSTETFTITLLTPDVGSYAALITIISDDADMSPFTFPISGSVTKATLTAAATNQSRLYGVNNPTLTIGYTGFVNSEDATVIDTAPTASSSATVSSGVGDYTITSAGGIDANYDFVYSNGTLTINKATLTAIVDNQSREYGAADPTFTIGYTGFVNSEDESVIDTTPTVTTVSTITSGAGDYTLTPTGGADDNYNFSYTDGTLMINKATLSATVDNQSREYGAADPTFTIGYTGFVNSEDESVIDTTPTVTTVSTITSGAGDYTLTSAGGIDDNYDFVYSNGTLTINKATLTATVDNQSREYGAADPTFTIGYAGFVNSEDESVIDTTPTVTTVSTITSGAGDYTLTSAGGIDDNYDFSYTDGIMTINKATLIATVDNQSRTYGAIDPAFTVGYTGFVNSEDESVIDTTPTVTTISTITSGAGDYTLTSAGGIDDNYDFSYTDGTLTINKATLTATVDNQSREYGAADPTFTIGYTGFVNSEDESVIDTTPTVTTVSTITSGAGDYTLTLTGGIDDNYDFSYTDGTLTVNKATLTATAANQSRLYGESNPTFTIDYTGFVNGEDATVIVTEPTATTTATAASDPGGYSIVLTGGLDDNYDFNLLNGTLTITVLNPSITSFTPSQALAGATITVTGTNFTGATSVQFGGTESASFVVDNDTQITAIVGSGSTGSISVTTPGGTGASVLSLTVDNVAPTVTSLTLNSIYTGTESSIEYLVTFDEDVINLDYTDFDLSTAGTATGTLNTTITGSGDTYLMSIDNISGTGSITLNAIVDDITDVAGNPLMAGLTGSVHNVDRDQPMITLLDMTNGSTNISNGSTVNFGSAIMGNDINRTFSVSNTGTADLNVTQVSLGTGTSYTNSSVTVPVVITPDSDFTFTTTLSEGVSGTFEDVITITSNDSIQPLYSFNLTGSIIEEVPIFSLFEGADNQGNPIDNDAVFSVDFGEVNLSDSIISKSFYIQNSGTGVLIVSQITSSDELLQIEADLPLSLAENEGESFKIIISENETGEINAILEIITNQFTTSIAVTADIVAAQEIEEESPPISVFNVVTPNGDGIHDYLKIVNIEEYQDNKVFIFSRVGDKVFEAIHYDNDDNRFEGYSNVNGNGKLSNGTYYYVIDNGTSKKEITGFFIIN